METDTLKLISERVKADRIKNSTGDLPDLDGFAHYLVSFSGGKDSQMAGNLALERFGYERCEFVFCMVDTEEDGLWEFKENLEHLRYMEKVWNKKIAIVLAASSTHSDEEATGLTQIVLNHGFMPGRKMPFCTRVKQRSLTHWHSQYDAETSCLIWGQRADESPSRARLPEYGLDVETKRYVWRPVHKYSSAQIFEGITARGQKANPVYYQEGSGRATQQGRANCKFCINSPKYELRKAVRRWPDAAARFVEKIEKQVGGRRDYSVEQAILDTQIEDMTPDMFQEENEIEQAMYEIEKPVCGVGGGFSCEV